MSRATLTTRFEGAAPILRVTDMRASVRYYVDVLGFRNVDWGTDDFTSVNRDRARIYTLPRSPGLPWHLGLDRCRGRCGGLRRIQGRGGQDPWRAAELPLGARNAR